MDTELKRFTISITPSMKFDLDVVKRERYYKVTRNDMMKDLIIRGLASVSKAENEQLSNPSK